MKTPIRRKSMTLALAVLVLFSSALSVAVAVRFVTRAGSETVAAPDRMPAYVIAPPDSQLIVNLPAAGQVAGTATVAPTPAPIRSPQIKAAGAAAMPAPSLQLARVNAAGVRALNTAAAAAAAPAPATLVSPIETRSAAATTSRAAQAPSALAAAAAKTGSSVPATSTLAPATSTSAPATATPAPATATPAPPTATPAPTATQLAPTPVPTQEAGVPDRIVAPEIGLDQKIIPVGWRELTDAQGNRTAEWTVASYAVSWHKTSAKLGEAGNTVLTGHNNIEGEVFRHLEDFNIGDPITIYSGQQAYHYTVADKFVVKELGVPYEQRLDNAKWIGRFPDERITLMSCWPYTGDSHRIFIIARPAG